MVDGGALGQRKYVHPSRHSAVGLTKRCVTFARAASR
jgi:hypothetical protein